jgi:hypothetical protein
VTDPATLAKISAAILGIFGAECHSIFPRDEVQQFERQLKQLGQMVEITIWADAGLQEPHDKEGRISSRDAGGAWTKAVNFLAATLK